MPMSPQKLASRFDRLDLRGMRLDRNDLLAMLACTPQEQWEAFFDAVGNYVRLQQGFLENTADRERFDAFAHCLLTMAYGSKARVDGFVEALRIFLGECVPDQPTWANEPCLPEEFRRDVVYELYVDLFATNFRGLISKLGYFEDLGVNVLWLLPFLDSPGDDGGYDQRDRTKVSLQLGGNPAFQDFVEAARLKRISIMMDLVLNHRSWESMEFQASSDPKHEAHNEYRDYFIWRNKGDDGRRTECYENARSMFQGMVAPSSGARFLSQAGKRICGPWSWHTIREAWYFHSFLPQQPDVNYDNPRVLIDDLKMLKHWLDDGIVRYVRLDAIPCLFKRDQRDINNEVRCAFPGTDLDFLVEDYNCNELPHVHILVRLISAFLTHRYNGRVGIVSESNCGIEKWKKYFGEGSGSKLNYQFYRMQGLWASLVREEGTPLARALSITIDVPRRCAGIMFARVHDELTFDHAEAEVTRRAIEDLMHRMKRVEPSDASRRAYEGVKKLLEEHRRKEVEETNTSNIDPNNPYSFCRRGIAARMSTLLRALPSNIESDQDNDLLDRYKLVMSLIMSLEDIPLIYMGDEWGETDNWENLHEASAGKGGLDQRRLHRALANPDTPQQLLDGGDTLCHKIYQITKSFIAARRANPVMQLGTLDLLSYPEMDASVLAFVRTLGKKRVLVATNFERRRKLVEVRLEGRDHLDAATELVTGQEHVIQTSQSSSVTVELKARQSLWLSLG